MSDTAFNPVDPEEHLGYLLARVADQIGRDWGAALREEGINPRQFSMLAWLAREPGLSQAELARRVLMTPQSASESVASLLEVGLVARKPGGAGLKAEVRLTRTGRALLRRAYPIVEATNRHGFRALTAAERTSLARLLHKVLGTR